MKKYNDLINNIAGIIHRTQKTNNISVFGGSSGLALFSFYYSLYAQNEDLLLKRNT